MKIYFTGSIAGGRQDAPIYNKLIQELKKYGEILTEHVGDEKLTNEGESKQFTPKEIHDRDIDWLKASDVLIAEITTPSLGVGYEIAFAVQHHKKILCLYRPSVVKRLSPMVHGSFGTTCKEYETIDQAKQIIQDYMLIFKQKK